MRKTAGRSCWVKKGRTSAWWDKFLTLFENLNGEIISVCLNKAFMNYVICYDPGYKEKKYSFKKNDHCTKNEVFH